MKLGFPREICQLVSSRCVKAAVGDFDGSRNENRAGLPCSSLGYQIVLGLKGARADPRGLRQTLDASAATWTGRLRPVFCSGSFGYRSQKSSVGNPAHAKTRTHP